MRQETDLAQKNNPKPRVYVETWGCQMNYHRSEGLGGLLREEGYRLTDEISRADLILFNTCAVRERSEEKVRGRIGQIKEERKADSLLGLGGCMAQHLSEDELREIKGVDFVFGTSNLSSVHELARRAREEGEVVIDKPRPQGFQRLPFERSSDYFAWVTIAEGCSNACSYCIVPRVRGPLRSRDPEKIFAETRQLVEAGYGEIQLLGQNVNSYGADLAEGIDFPWLLESVAQMEPPRISFTTPNPADLNLRTLDLMNEYDNICRHLHLPLQSGSDRVLEIMNRDYDRGEFLHLVEEARERDPLVNITTDVIVGHPGEREADFERTLEVLEEVNFGAVYGAKFSPRPGTKSALMEDSLPREEKERRLQLLLEKQKETNYEGNQKFIGLNCKVLLEGEAREEGKLYGKNEFKKTVLAPGDSDLIGQFLEVEIESFTEGVLLGRPLEQ